MDNNIGNGYNNNPNNGYNNNKNPNNKDNNGNKKRQNIILIVIALIFSALAVSALSSLYTSATSEEITYDKFLDMIENEQVKSVVISTSGKITITPKENNSLSTNSKTGLKMTYYKIGRAACRERV